MNFLRGKMTFLSGQDDFFQTANQPISVCHLSHPYNKQYIALPLASCANGCVFVNTLSSTSVHFFVFSFDLACACSRLFTCDECVKDKTKKFSEHRH